MLPDNCRCCLQQLPHEDRIQLSEKVPIFGQTFARLIQDFTGINFASSEVSECCICLACQQQIMDFYNWKSVVLAANTQLKGFAEPPRTKGAAIKVELEDAVRMPEVKVEIKELKEERPFLTNEAVKFFHSTKLPKKKRTPRQEIADGEGGIRYSRSAYRREQEERQKLGRKLYKRNVNDLYECPSCPKTFR